MVGAGFHEVTLFFSRRQGLGPARAAYAPPVNPASPLCACKSAAAVRPTLAIAPDPPGFKPPFFPVLVLECGPSIGPALAYGYFKGESWNFYLAVKC